MCCCNALRAIVLNVRECILHIKLRPKTAEIRRRQNAWNFTETETETETEMSVHCVHIAKPVNN